MGADVTEELRKFGETVSVKGVPRIFKAQNTAIRALWLIAVLVSSGILAWQLTKVFVNYFSWPVQSVYQEGKGRPTFPDVTICKLYSTRSDLKQDPRLNNYTDIIESKIVKINEKMMLTSEYDYNGWTPEEEYDYIWSLLDDPSRYFTIFPRSNASSSERLIIKSIYFSWAWDIASVDKSPEYLWDSNYGPCYTIQLNDSVIRSDVQGITMLLYIDNFPSTLTDSYILDPTQSLATGVRVTVSAYGARPNIKEGINVGPGTETTIRLWQTTRHRVPYPYGSCTAQKRADIADNKSAAYTKDDCFSVCLQQAYIDECKCINSNLYNSPRQSEEVNGVVCGTTGALNASSIEDFIQLHCVAQADYNVDSCQSLCADPCNEFEYDLSVSSAPWPHPSVQLAFYDDYIAQKPHIFGDKFSAYGKISGETKNKTLSDAQAISLLRNMDGLQNNFIQLSVFFEHYTPMILQESPAVTSDKMLSLIGGALSLWLGISVMTVVEFVQFIFDLIAAIQRKRTSVGTDNCSKK